MNPKKIQAKLFTQSAVDLTAIVPIFHRWIQDDLLDGLLLDVADYRHVPNGPGVLLIGHEGDYALDLSNGRPGISYKHKRDWPAHAESLSSRCAFVIQKVETAAKLLTQQAGLAFDQNEVELRFPDRLSTPNTVDSFASILQVFAEESKTIFGVKDCEFSYQSAGLRQPLTIKVEHVPVEQVA